MDFYLEQKPYIGLRGASLSSTRIYFNLCGKSIVTKRERCTFAMFKQSKTSTVLKDNSEH